MRSEQEKTGKLRIAVIGVGADSNSRARQYLQTISRLRDHYVLSAICDTNADVLSEVANELQVPACYTRVRDFFNSEKPDVLLNLAPKDSHIVMALTAARHGIHVITEIPVALTKRYAQAIARECEKHDVLWEIAEQVWVRPRELLKRKIIKAGLIGKVTQAHLWYQSGPYHGFSSIRRQVDAEAKRVLGYWSEVETEPYTAYGGEQESTYKWECAVIEFDNGVTCLFERPPRLWELPGRTYPAGWHIEGTKGHLDRNQLTIFGKVSPHTYDITEQYSEVDGNRVFDQVYVDTDPRITLESPFKQYGIGSDDDVAKASILVGFHESITQGKKVQYGVENGLGDWEICLAVRESADRGNTWVSLPLQEPTQVERRIEVEFVNRYGHDPIEETDALLDVTFTRSATLWKVTHWL